MSARARIGHLFRTLNRWWLPEATPPRLLLLFIASSFFLLATIPSILFIKYPRMHNAGMAVCIIVLFSIIFATTFAMAKPDTDDRLQKHRRKLVFGSRIIAVLLAAGSIGMIIVMIPWLSAKSVVWVFGKIEVPPVTSDALVVTRQANRLLLEGEDPYGQTNIIKAMEEFGGVLPTTLRQGDFAHIYPYPSQKQIDDAIAKAKATPNVRPLDLESTLSYPAGSFLFRIPFDASGVPPQWFYLLCVVVMATVIVWRAPAYLRPVAIIGCLASVLVWNSQLGGGTEALFILFVLLAWTLRKRPWLAGVLMGVACSCKQTAWFFALFYLVLMLRETGWRKALQSVAIIGATFIVINSPFIIAHPSAWITGVLAPMIHPLFPSGIGLSSLATLSSTAVPQAIFTALEFVVLVGALAWYYRNCRKAPQTGLLLAIIPLFFAWRSQFDYFVMIPLLVFGAILIEEYKQGHGETSDAASRSRHELTGIWSRSSEAI